MSINSAREALDETKANPDKTRGEFNQPRDNTGRPKPPSASESEAAKTARRVRKALDDYEFEQAKNASAESELEDLWSSIDE